MQPGVASVYCTIVQQTQRGVEFYLKRFPEFSGRTFGEARRAFNDAVLCGYVRETPAGQPDMHVNCPDSDVLQDGDRVIALSQTGGGAPLAASAQHRLGGASLSSCVMQHCGKLACYGESDSLARGSSRRGAQFIRQAEQLCWILWHGRRAQL